VSRPDPYKILQVDPEAEDEVIEAAYRRLARKYHPDVASGGDAAARMVAINQAWEVLRNPVSRSAVDRARSHSIEHGEQPPAADGGTHGRAGGAPPVSPSTSGMPDLSDTGSTNRRPDTVSRDWTSGRSTTGSTYDPATMQFAQGHGAAGAPPGRPSGSVLNFGRYAGWSLGEIARADVEYLEWLDRMPIGRTYQQEIDRHLRSAGRRRSAPAEDTGKRGLFRRR
jgi:curved DNA-binding protein CbpA